MFDKDLLERLHVDYQVMHFDSNVSSSMIRKDLLNNLVSKPFGSNIYSNKQPI